MKSLNDIHFRSYINLVLLETLKEYLFKYNIIKKVILLLKINLTNFLLLVLLEIMRPLMILY